MDAGPKDRPGIRTYAEVADCWDRQRAGRGLVAPGQIGSALRGEGRDAVVLSYKSRGFTQERDPSLGTCVDSGVAPNDLRLGFGIGPLEGR